jgi:hypothetical protein
MDNVTDFGFDWGPMRVQRLAHIEGRGYVLEIATDAKVMQVYVTEAGRKIEPYPVRERARQPVRGA